MIRRSAARHLTAAGVLVVLFVTACQRSRSSAPAIAAGLGTGEPALMLWAWEAPEDLRSLDTAHTGVAFLAGEVTLGSSAQVTGRRQPLRLAPGTWLMADVRLEPSPAFHDSPALRAQTVRALLHAAALPQVRALQIDFDAAVSQREFYLAVVRALRPQLPARMPLSVTALTSWCAAHGLLGSPATWLDDLHVNEAVPMFFRMGGERTGAALRPRSYDTVAAPVCRGSAGISTDEAVPSHVPPGTRIYLFKPGPWTQNDLAQLRRGGYAALVAPSLPTPR